MVVALRGALALVFAIAAVAKLRDPTGTRRAVAEFGVSEGLAPTAALGLPLAELATALALVPDRTARAAAAAALVLLAVFVAAIAANLARGRRPACNCFGQLHSAPAGLTTIGRNLGLAAAAALVLGADGHLGEAASASATLAVAALVLLAVDRRRASAADGPGDAAAGVAAPAAPGTPAPPFELPSREGREVGLDALLARDRPVLLVFSDTHCGPCLDLAPHIARWQRRHADEVTIAVLERGGGDGGPDEHGRRDVLHQRESETAEAYGARGTPSAVLVDAAGRIASDMAAGAVAIEALLAEHVLGFEGGRVADATSPSRELIPRREALVRLGAALGTVGASLGFPAWAGAAMPALSGKRCRNILDCPGSQHCIDGKCGCPALYLDECGTGLCVDINGDAANCGACGNACAAGQSCVGGKCTKGDTDTCIPPCPPGSACCLTANGVICTVLGDSVHDCGRCGQRCAPDEICCDGRCKNLFNDPSRCASDELGCFGLDKKKCKKGQVCYSGHCLDKCPKGAQRCGGTCFQPSRGQQCCGGRVFSVGDDHNCGTCGHDCTKLSGFIAGACCGGFGCVDLAVNPDHCGACGHSCPSDCVCQPGPGGKGICTPGAPGVVC